MTLLCLLLLCLLVGCQSPAAQNTVTIPTPSPEPFYAPEFSLTALDGTRIALTDLRGQWVIVNFWATWCVPCVEEMPALQAIADEYAGELVLLGINVRETAEEVAAFAADHDLDFPLLINPDDTTLLNYQVVGLPQTVVISPTGEIVDRRFGPLELETFRQDIDQLVRQSSDGS